VRSVVILRFTKQTNKMKKKADVVAILMAAKIVVIIMFLVLTSALSSCDPPRSQQRTKAVVIDCLPKKTSTGHVQYRLNYLSYGVVDHEFSYFQYEIGDTILVFDKFRGQDIK
jgi:hypothetical protein